jgi:hypothetical protein
VSPTRHVTRCLTWLLTCAHPERRILYICSTAVPLPKEDRTIQEYNSPPACMLCDTMSTTLSPTSWSICFSPKTYKEETEGKGSQPKRRGLNFVLDSFDRKWYIKLTFQGVLYISPKNTFAKVTKRRKDLENLCLCIDFQSIKLLDDTVTELLLTREQNTFCHH